MSKVKGAIELAVTGGALATSFILPHEGAGGLQLCPWYHLTGVECPFCGMTRGFVAISHGDLPTAVDLNEGSPLIYGAFVVIFGRSVIALRNGDIGQLPEVPEKVVKPWLFTSIAVFSWLFVTRWVLPFFEWIL